MNNSTFAVQSRAAAILTAAAALGGCLFTCGPYACAQAVEGRAVYAPVLDAIEAYRQDNGAYPESLPDLTPGYIESIPLSPDASGPGWPSYFRTDDSYSFAFRYFGPGANTCIYTPAESWQCDGYY